MAKHSSKETTVSFRLNESWYKALKELSEYQNKKKSKIFREALELYFRNVADNSDLETSSSIFTQKVLSLLFQEFPLEKIPELAQIAYLGGISQFEKITKKLPKNYQQIIKDVAGKKLKATSAADLIKILTKEVFPPAKNHWFEHVSYEIKHHTIYFRGKHRFGEKFSYFIKDLLVKYFHLFGYSLGSETYEFINQVHREKSEEVSQIFHSVALSFSKE
jgi:DNA-binding ferritin-like protein (Dps family)